MPHSASKPATQQVRVSPTRGDGASHVKVGTLAWPRKAGRAMPLCNSDRDQRWPGRQYVPAHNGIGGGWATSVILGKKVLMNVSKCHSARQGLPAAALASSAIAAASFMASN